MSGSRSSRARRSLVAPHIAALPKSGIRDFFDLVSSMEGVISLGIGEPDFVTPWSIRKHALYSIERGHTHYTSNLGLTALREAICGYLASDFGVTYDPACECLVTVGVSEALDLAIRAVVSPGDEVIYHEPSYVSYNPEVRMAHGVPVAVKTREENDFTLDPADLEQAVTPKTRAILLNFPCNPTGATLSVSQTRHIAEIARKHDLIVLADHIYSELTYGKMTPSIASFPGMKERTVFLHGFSKAFAMTGFRIGYACGPAELINGMMKIHQYSMLCAPVTAQEAALAALRYGRGDMLAMRDEYRDRRNVIVNSLNSMGLPCFKPRGAFYVFPNITSSALTSMEFATRLLKSQKVAVVPGPAFGPGGEGFVRCSYAASMADIREAMARLRKFLGQLNK